MCILENRKNENHSNCDERIQFEYFFIAHFSKFDQPYVSTQLCVGYLRLCAASQ